MVPRPFGIIRNPHVLVNTALAAIFRPPSKVRKGAGMPCELRRDEELTGNCIGPLPSEDVPAALAS